MRTLVFLIVGLALGGACLGVARYVAGASAATLNGVLAAFALLWFAVAAANLWIGVSRAGYAFREEFPIFLLIWLAPLVLVALARWKLP